MTMKVEQFPAPGETLLGQDFNMGPGGKGSNQAVGAARLGARASIVVMIGDDQFGAMGSRLWRDEGVEQQFVFRTRVKPTGVGFIVVNAKGENEIVVDPGANALLTSQHVKEAAQVIRTSDVVLSVLEISPDVAGNAMAMAKSLGKISILNPAPAQALPKSILDNLSFVTPNEGELHQLLGVPHEIPLPVEDLARSLKQETPGGVITTLGERGAFVIYPDGREELVPSVPVNVVDSTGAGDAFNAGLAVALARGDGLHDAVVFANKCGALACTMLGVIPALPNLDDVLSVG